MSKVPFRVSSRYFVAFALASALAVMLAPSLSFAARSLCRSDPIVKLSNGQTIVLWSEIYGELDDIQSVEYHLHVPKGVRAVEVIHPYPEMADREVFYFYDDQLPLSYKATIRANVNGQVTVRAHMDIRLVLKILATSLWNTGESNRDLNIRIAII